MNLCHVNRSVYVIIYVYPQYMYIDSKSDMYYYFSLFFLIFIYSILFVVAFDSVKLKEFFKFRFEIFGFCSFFLLPLVVFAFNSAFISQTNRSWNIFVFIFVLVPFEIFSVCSFSLSLVLILSLSSLDCVLVFSFQLLLRSHLIL